MPNHKILTQTHADDISQCFYFWKRKQKQTETESRLQSFRRQINSVYLAKLSRFHLNTEEEIRLRKGQNLVSEGDILALPSGSN
jgi:hypothetical protein